MHLFQYTAALMEEEITTYSHFLSINQLRDTKQRRLIFETFMEDRKHYTAEGLYQTLQKELPHIGQATVYRTLKLLCENGFARELNLRSNQGGVNGTNTLSSYFEPVCASKPPHDHLICTDCGEHFEFNNEELEELQEKIAVEQGFLLTYHTHILYGICKSCQDSKP